jgi:4-hydroxybenzoate polyprenyltransferase
MSLHGQDSALPAADARAPIASPDDLSGTERRRLATWLRALRLHHWSKNLFVFVPILLGHLYGDVTKLAASVAAFVLLGLLVSAGYLINGVTDIEADRQHKSKRHRPFASGRISPRAGIAAAAVLIAIAFAGAALVSRGLLTVLVAYFLLTVGYSLWLKTVALVDVAAIATMLTLRIAAGGAAIGTGQSAWLLSFSAAFFLSLALAKRHSELMQATQASPGPIAGRGFRSEDWPLTLAFGVGAGIASIIIMLLYLANDATPSGFYPHQGWLYAVPGLVLIWLMRVWVLSHRTELHDDPVIFALKDPASLFLGAMVVAAFALAL